MPDRLAGGASGGRLSGRGRGGSGGPGRASASLRQISAAGVPFRVAPAAPRAGRVGARSAVVDAPPCHRDGIPTVPLPARHVAATHGPYTAAIPPTAWGGWEAGMRGVAGALAWHGAWLGAICLAVDAIAAAWGAGAYGLAVAIVALGLGGLLAYAAVAAVIPD